ncbi:SRPBCC family protein [Rhizobium halophilum]|uniref:SRPBCC family protein n=1 Tax=Rhizobium halophilum TaxID=2846852 RepID=UPI001EFD375A|nr:carbon monoxide dehydrogenase subunit G [Rhizobium halophilum]MCF6367266.1 carbon monoxide dehydrogenase subunit G [Rhizobium halophilum]
MEMTGQQMIPATKEEVWAALNDPEVLKLCIPGCQELVKTSDTEMSAVAVMRVGPVKARFQGNVTLSDLDPPHGYKISGEGQGGVAGFAKGDATVKLEAVDDGTMLHYSVAAQIGGKLSQLGGRLIDVTAKQMAGHFFAKFSEEIQARKALPASGSQKQDGSIQLTAQHGGATEPANPAAPAAPSAGPSGGSLIADTRGAASLPVLSLIVFVSMLAALAVYSLISPALTSESGVLDGVSPDLTTVALLAMAAAIGYLFGARSR